MKTIKAKNYGKNEITLVSGLRQNGIRLRAVSLFFRFSKGSARARER